MLSTTVILNSTFQAFGKVKTFVSSVWNKGVELVYRTEKVSPLSLNNVLSINCNIPENLQEIEPHILPYITLNKIMTCEYENGLCCYYKPSGTNLDDSDSEDDDDDDKITCNTKGDDRRNDSCTIHPVDNLLTQIKASDNILRQNIMSKLSLCQVAVPLLLPSHNKNTVTFLLWALRCIVKKWDLVLSNNSKSYIESPIVDCLSPVISFLRIGYIHTSKSEILNHAIGEFDFFFYKGCNRVKCEKKSTEGLVDFCCYLPNSSKNKFLFDNPILFFNLHGDARKSTKQVNFIQKLSLLSFIFVNENEIDQSALQLINYLAQSNKIVVFVEKVSKPKLAFPDNVKIISFKAGKSMHFFEEKIQKVVTETVKNSNKNVKLSECSQIAKSCKIIIDEDDDKNCQKAYEHAKEILQEIEGCSAVEAKKKFFPLQEKWQNWAEIDKQQYQEIGKQTSNVERHNAAKNAQKMKIREQMEPHCKKMTNPIDTFLKAFLKFNITTKYYFFAWLKLLLDEYNRKEFAKCSTQQIPITTIGLEHFFREIGQIYETVKCLRKGIGKTSNAANYPRIMAELIADGYCMEIMDGESTHVPIDWVTAVFNELQEMHKHDKLYTVSIVGLQSSGKSTLLNIMFGLNFNVSAGRCTRGAFMQLLSFKNDPKFVCKCDRLLLIDTEGLRAPELESISKQHDNQLATFVVGLADVAIVNIFGENQADVNDILQTVSHALIRINNINISPSCKFIHHGISEPGAEAKTASGRRKFIEVLDENIQKACELEFCKGKFNSFSELMNFDEIQDVLYFKHLWHGNPPMAKINMEYTKNAQNFKMSLMNHISHQHKCYSFADFSIKINALWNSVLCEQFLFSFKNTLEVIVRREYDRKHSEWNAMLRLDLLKWEANLLFHKDESQDIKEMEEMLLVDVEKILNKRKTLILKERNDYFVESKHKAVLAEWKDKSNEKIDNYYQEYMEWARHSIAQLRIKHTSEIEVQKVISTIHTKLDILADELFTSDMHTWLSDEILEEKFNEKWSAWLDEIPSVEYKSPEDIQKQILLLMQNCFKMDLNLIHQNLLKTPLIQQKTVFTPDDKIHIEIKKNHKITNREALNSAESFISDKLKEFSRHMESKAMENVYSYQGMLHEFDQQLRELITKVEKTDLDGAFHLTKRGVLDIAFTASKQTLDLLISCETKARKNNAKEELEEKKVGFIELLCMLYQGKKRTQEEILEMQRQCDIIKERFKKEVEKHDEWVQKNLEEQKMYEKELNDAKEKHEAKMKEIEQNIKSDKDKLKEEYILKSKELKELYEFEKQSIEEKLEKTAQAKKNKQLELETDMKRLEKEHSAKLEESKKSEQEEKERLDILTYSQTQVIGYLFEMIKVAINKALKNSMNIEVCEDITKSNPKFKNKENFKLAVLQHLLNENFDEYELYFTDTETCYKKWMAIFLKEHCFKLDHSIKLYNFHKLVNRKLKELLTSVQTAITETNIDGNNLTISLWINEFSVNIHKKLSLSEKDINNSAISKLHRNITWKCVDEVESFKHMFKMKFEINNFQKDTGQFYDEIEGQLTDYMWKTLKKSFMGCTARCPFCKEMCDSEDICDYENKNERHSVELHRPQCLGKYTWVKTKEMVVEVCTTLIGSDYKFRNQDTHWEFKPYKQYQDKSLYPNWDISFTTKPLQPYWIWVIAHFDKKIAKWCGGNTNSIPKEWYDTSKKSARDCVELPGT